MKNDNPIVSRYASEEMSHLFSYEYRTILWRKLWLALAESEKELGLDITEEQIEQMRQNIYNIDYEYIAQKEKETKHDVMAHLLAFCKVCDKARPIIHLGATSCFVTDNSDQIIFYEALLLVKKKLQKIMETLCNFVIKFAYLPCIGFTHLQPAQFTTVGKRASLWLYDLYLDYNKLNYFLEIFALRSIKGATGTLASFLQLFDNDEEKVRLLERKIPRKMGFNSVIEIASQTYSRKIDYEILSLLSSISQSCYKFANDLRLLQSMKEIREPFFEDQVGSSAMPYKRNPILCERICSLSRYVICLPQNTAFTACVQWLERSLDDSANRRISLSQGFMVLDGVLDLYNFVIKNINVDIENINCHTKENVILVATENLLMKCVALGGDRQNLHEKIRKYSKEALSKNELKILIDFIANDNDFKEKIEEKDLEPNNYIGLAKIQAIKFAKKCLLAIRK